MFQNVLDLDEWVKGSEVAPFFLSLGALRARMSVLAALVTPNAHYRSWPHTTSFTSDGFEKQNHIDQRHLEHCRTMSV
jgi:hypothetical protein